MSEAEYRDTLENYRRRMFRNIELDAETCCAASDWMNGEIAQLEQEMKNTRVGARVPLRVRLKNLVSAIVSQNSQAVKEVSHGTVK